MAELRKDPTVGRWVVIATERVRRPSDFVRPRSPRREGPCAFCVGHERETPPEILAYRDPPGAPPDTPGWHVRVVPSKFPILQPGGEIERRGLDMYDLMNAIGLHEVVLAAPTHDTSLGRLPAGGVEEVLRACHERFVALRRHDRFRSITLLAHHGVESGPVAGHPHLQIVAAPIVPLALADELDHARTYHDFRERCLFCDMLRQEVETQLRVVVETPQVVAFAPFASRTPFETWILPRRHSAGFEHADPEELRDVARVLHTVLRKLDDALGDPPHTLVLHSAPSGSGESPSFHWHLELTPALSVPGPDEGSTFHVNPVPPEDAARFLRDAAP